MSFNPQFSWDSLPNEEIEIRTLQALRNHITYLKQHSPYYTRLLTEIEPTDIQTLDDITKLPFTSKEQLNLCYKELSIAPQKERIQMIVTQKPRQILIPLTSTDAERVAYSSALSLHSLGITHNDTALLTLESGAMSLDAEMVHEGLMILEATTVRTGMADSEFQKMIIEQAKPTILIGIPSYLVKLGTYLEREVPRKILSSIQKIILINYSVYEKDGSLNSDGKLLKKYFGVPIYSVFIKPEVLASFGECQKQKGYHSHPELLYTEIVDENDEKVADGTIGEVVITPFWIEGMPLLRYKTGIKSCIEKKICECGRTSIRLSSFEKEEEASIVFKGAEIAPSNLVAILDALPTIEEYLIELRGNKESTREEIIIHVVAKATEVGAIMNHIRICTTIQIPVLITNRVTINAMRRGYDATKKVIDTRK